jgi:hypothetical protein
LPNFLRNPCATVPPCRSQAQHSDAESAIRAGQFTGGPIDLLRVVVTGVFLHRGAPDSDGRRLSVIGIKT